MDVLQAEVARYQGVIAEITAEKACTRCCRSGPVGVPASLTLLVTPYERQEPAPTS